MNDFEDPSNDRRDNSWHLDKKVPLTLIFAMMVQTGAVVWAVADIKKDVEILKMQAVGQHERDERQDKSSAEAYTRLSVYLEKMDAKLDRLVEKRQ